MKAQESFEYNGKLYPDYIRRGDAVKHIVPIAEQFCKGEGLDIGGTNDWHFPGARPVNIIEEDEWSAFNLPPSENGYDYIFSSHCLEHIEKADKALKVWYDALKVGGQLFLYLPHREMEYWLPENCEKHIHSFTPMSIVRELTFLGFEDVFWSERDLYWSFAVTGVKT